MPEVFDRIDVQNNPINWIDPWGLAPGDPFGSPNDAAVDAIDYVMSNKPQYSNQHPEWGGWIYSFANPSSGKTQYSYTDPVAGEPGRINSSKFNESPCGSKKEAAYHTHPGSGYPTERFSQDDYIWAAFNSPKSIYMGNRKGLILKHTTYNFSSQPSETVTIREPRY